MGDNVENIENRVFYNCTSLKSVVIPGSVESIGEYAFYNCISLKSINIPEYVMSIGYSAFYNCTAIEEIYFKAMNAYDFSSYNSVFCNVGQNGTGTKVTIGKNVKRLPDYLFYPYSGNYTPKITSVEFEKGSVCEEIGDYAFTECTALNSINIPDKLTSIGYEAFYYCQGLKSINI